MKISNMKNSKGRSIANQFTITTGGTTYFQSYDSIIVEAKDNITTLDETYWNYSRTTSKYRNQFLGETTKETQAKIEAGVYRLANLNVEVKL